MIPKLHVVKEGETKATYEQEHSLTARQLELKALLERRGFTGREAKKAAELMGDAVGLYDGLDSCISEFFDDLEKLQESTEAVVERRSWSAIPLVIDDVDGK